MEIKPVNAPSEYSFKLSKIKQIKIKGYPPNKSLKLGWNEAIKEINRHKQILLQARIWSPYPIQAYCVGAAQALSLSNSLSEMDLLGVEPDGSFEVRPQKGGLFLKPISAKQAYEIIAKKHRKSLDKLAK